MRKLIFNALAFSDTGPITIQMKEVANVKEVYLQNSFVSLRSVQLLNPDVDVCLITNRQLPEPYQSLFFDNGIKVIIISYNTYQMPDTFHWQLAFFKLCALNYAVNNLQYDRYVMLDADTYCTKNLQDFWQEWNDKAILLYQLTSTFSESTRKEIIDGYATIYGRPESIINYGGELMAGYASTLQSFMKTCRNVQEDTIAHLDKVSKNIGDEFITSIAVVQSGIPVVSVNAYLERYWTGRAYQCATNYNTTAIWHIPAEKSYTMLKLFHYYNKNKSFPPDKKAAEWAGFPKRSRTHALPFYAHRLKEKIVKKWFA